MARLGFKEAVKMSVLPSPADYVRTSVTMPKATWERVDALMREVNAERDPPNRFTRDEMLRYLVDWACVALTDERRGKANSRQRGSKA